MQSTQKIKLNLLYRSRTQTKERTISALFKLHSSAYLLSSIAEQMKKLQE